MGLHMGDLDLIARSPDRNVPEACQHSKMTKK